MEIIIAVNSGFCFGVKNAVEKAIALSEKQKFVYTVGSLIHNDAVVKELEDKGIKVLKNIEELKEGDILIIRSHGIGKDQYHALKNKKVEIVDATCINVKRIHKIVEDKSIEGYHIIIIGDKNHPEVSGIKGWCGNSAEIIENLEGLKNMQIYNKICVVAQTTYNKQNWHAIACEILKYSKEVIIFDTICSTTGARQNEIRKLSKEVDAMVVVGGRDSSNTKKLYDISTENCKSVYYIQDSNDLKLCDFKEYNKVGIAGGASTPDYIIKEVVKKLNTIDYENIENEQNNEEERKQFKETKFNNLDSQNKDDIVDYFANYNDIYPGCIVEGKIIQVSNKELFVDICYKSDGILPVEEASNMPIDLKEKFKPGDLMEAKILRMNNGEGHVLLSRKEMEKDDFIKMLTKYKEEGTIIEINVNGLNKGGFNCSFGDISAFMPLSQSGLARNDSPEELVGKRMKVKIIDLNRKRNNYELVISRREIVREEMDSRKKEFIETLSEGMILEGTVKAFIQSGAFVRVNEIDVFIPISEIAWKRIGKPQDVLSEGQKVKLIIIRLDKQALKVTGSIKRSGKEPWEEFITKYNENDIIDVKVARFADFGVFVEIIDGVDGLIHISNLADRRVNKPQDIVKIGEMLKARIIKIDNEGKKVSLSLREEIKEAAPKEIKEEKEVAEETHLDNAGALTQDPPEALESLVIAEDKE